MKQYPINPKQFSEYLDSLSDARSSLKVPENAIRFQYCFRFRVGIDHYEERRQEDPVINHDEEEGLMGKQSKHNKYSKYNKYNAQENITDLEYPVNYVWYKRCAALDPLTASALGYDSHTIVTMAQV